MKVKLLRKLREYHKVVEVGRGKYEVRSRVNNWLIGDNYYLFAFRNVYDTRKVRREYILESLEKHRESMFKKKHFKSEF